jgi:hypothetical protein
MDFKEAWLVLVFGSILFALGFEVDEQLILD